MTTIDRDETRRRAQGAIDAERRTAIGPFTFNKARPVLAPREVLDLLDAIDQAEHRASRAEAQSETRRLDMEYWQERAEGFEARIQEVEDICVKPMAVKVQGSTEADAAAAAVAAVVLRALDGDNGA